MKATYRTATAAMMAVFATGILEWSLMILLQDHGDCFFHNQYFGILLAILLRTVFFFFCFALFRVMLMPPYASVKDRLAANEAAAGLQQPVHHHGMLAISE